MGIQHHGHEISRTIWPSATGLERPQSQYARQRSRRFSLVVPQECILASDNGEPILETVNITTGAINRMAVRQGRIDNCQRTKGYAGAVLNQIDLIELLEAKINSLLLNDGQLLPKPARYICVVLMEKLQEYKNTW